ncbi:MAG: serine hydrolase, partial [Chloroflexaceae bacterium]|nr:serine hydrolase [Chloroflexaceae bacterium]
MVRLLRILSWFLVLVSFSGVSRSLATPEPLSLSSEQSDGHITLDELGAYVATLDMVWDGTIGFYWRDLNSTRTASYHADVIFPAASVMKVAILLYVYAHVPEFDDTEYDLLYQMVVYSNNWSANAMLALGAGGGVDDGYSAQLGAEEMTTMLHTLGLSDTVQLYPYDAGQDGYQMRLSMITPAVRRDPADGYATESVPVTDPWMQTTAEEISQVFLWIDECRNGTGRLLQHFPETLSAKRCQEMLDILAQSSDATRLVAGLPPGTRVEHKGAWLDDMQADVGIIRLDGHEYLVAIYAYREGYLLDDAVRPLIARISQTIAQAYQFDSRPSPPAPLPR